VNICTGGVTPRYKCVLSPSVIPAPLPTDISISSVLPPFFPLFSFLFFNSCFKNHKNETYTNITITQSYESQEYISTRIIITINLTNILLVYRLKSHNTNKNHLRFEQITKKKQNLLQASARPPPAGASVCVSPAGPHAWFRARRALCWPLPYGLNSARVGPRAGRRPAA
jgi:hypothetical protein